MSFSGWQQTEVSDLRGAWTRLDSREARPNRAFVAQNVRYEPGRVRTRDAFVAITGRSVSAKATTFHNWIASGLNRLIYCAGGTQVRMIDLVAGTDSLLYGSLTCRGVSVAEMGDKALIAAFNAAGGGADFVRIAQPLASGAPIDKAFPAPISNSFTASDFSSGNASQGTKRLGYIIETRTGYTGKPAPAPGAVFTPVSFTVAAGGRKVRGQMTFNVPADAVYLHPICTRTDNPDKWYFEPGASIALPGGTAGYTATWYYNTPDESLEASATEVVDNFDLLTQDGSGNGPIAPHCVVAYGKRAVYLTPHRAYISEPGDYQFITEALHGLELPGRKEMRTAFPFRQSLYLLGPGWTYEVADNTDYPSTWANATEISNAIGSPAIQGVCWQTAGDYVWVAAESGLYLFNGSYARIPISYMNSDWWERINWAAAQSLKVLDDYIRQRVIVAAPLDGATEPNYLLVWDYARGLTATDVDFAYYQSDVAGFSALGLVQNATTGELELWAGPPTDGAIRREMAGIACEHASAYETGLVRGKKKYSFFGGVDLDVSGSGTLAITAYGVDRVQSVSALALNMSATPAESPQRRFHLQGESASVKVSVPAGSEFDLSGMTVYTKPWVGNK